MTTHGAREPAWFEARGQVAGGYLTIAATCGDAMPSDQFTV